MLFDKKFKEIEDKINSVDVKHGQKIMELNSKTDSLNTRIDTLSPRLEKVINVVNGYLRGTQEIKFENMKKEMTGFLSDEVGKTVEDKMIGIMGALVKNLDRSGVEEKKESNEPKKGVAVADLAGPSSEILKLRKDVTDMGKTISALSNALSNTMGAEIKALKTHQASLENFNKEVTSKLTSFEANLSSLIERQKREEDLLTKLIKKIDEYEAEKPI